MINERHKGQLIVSLDFELFWGMQDGHTLESYQDHVLGGRKAIPQLLKLFEKHGIHATWATVGLMFAENREEARRYFPEEDRLPHYRNAKLSSYRLFADPAFPTGHEDCFFAPDLIRLVSEAPGQEIGSHTYSHYYCREAGQTAEEFSADLDAAIRIAGDKGYALRSIVFPRNQTIPAYEKIVASKGFVAYRDEEQDWIHERVRNHTLLRALRLMDVYLPLTGQGGYQPRKEGDLVHLPGSRMYKPRFDKLFFLEGLKIHRIKRQMLHAAKKGLTFHLWWHPHNIGVHTDFHMRQLEEIFLYYRKLHDEYGMESLNMSEAAERVSN